MRRPTPGAGALSAAVAAGFGVLGWLAAQLATLHVFGHGHADAAGHGYRHLHGVAAPVAISAVCLVLAALCALWLLPSAPARAQRSPSRPGLALTIPVAAFAALEIGSALVTGTRPSDTLAVLLVGGIVQAVFGWAARGLTRASVRAVSTPCLFVPGILAVASGPVTAAPGTGLVRYLAAPRSSRAPPLRTGI